MDERDPALRAALEAALARARACRAPGRAADVLALRLADVLDTFYG